MADSDKAPANSNPPEEEEEEDEDLFKVDDDDEKSGGDGEKPKEPQYEGTATAETNSGEANQQTEPATAAPSTTSAPLGDKLDPSKFGLPKECTIPISVQASLLQGRLLETLRGLPAQLINDALAEYDDAVQIKGDAIRNHGAYLYGVIKRYVSVQERASKGEGQGILPMGAELTPAVNTRLQKLVHDNFCTEEEMNEKVKSKIRMLSETDALFAIDELSSVPRSQIRNFGSYFMGILNRYMRGEKKEMKQRQPQQGHAPGRHDDHRRDDRFHRGRDSNPEFRRRDNHDRNEAYHRERSRERYEPGRYQEPSSWRGDYDPRQAKPPYLGQQYQQPPMSGIPGHPPPPPPRTGPGLNPYQQPMQNLNQPYAPMNQPQFPPPVGGAPPQSSVYGNPPNLQYSQRAPVPGAPQMYNPATPSPYNNAQGGMTMNQGMRANQPMMGHQSSNSYLNPPHQTLQNPPMQNRFSQPPPQGLGRWQSPQTGMQNSPGNAPVDILGLADKAASVVQALQSQKFQIPPAAPAGMHQPVPPPYASPVHPSIPPHMFVPQTYPSSVPPTMPPGQNAMGQQRRRTTSSLVELPITVQYAVQNLQATGQIDGPLDEGILGMIKDLPENLALQALQKFSSIDKNTMRNKTAYLAGVLRRELEKINRR